VIVARLSARAAVVVAADTIANAPNMVISFKVFLVMYCLGLKSSVSSWYAYYRAPRKRLDRNANHENALSAGT